MRKFYYCNRCMLVYYGDDRLENARCGAVVGNDLGVCEGRIVYLDPAKDDE